MNKKTLIFIRNSDFHFDPRMQREANAALKLGFNVIALDWIRDKSQHPEVIQLANGIVKVQHYYRIAPFGKGLKNIINLVKYNIWIYQQLKNLNREREYEIIHACDLDVVLPAYLISKLHKKKIVYDIFDFYAHTHAMPSVLKKIIEWLEYKIISLVDVVIVCIEKRVNQIEKANPRNCFVIENTPDINITMLPQKMVKGDKDKFKIVYTGTLAPEGRLLFEILHQAPKYKKIELHVAGIGPLVDYVAEMAQQHDNIFFYGLISIEQALQLESECDLLFATYDPAIAINRFSAPNKISEAMAFKKPIIVCRDTSADEVIENHEMGLVINYDADEFWKASNYLADNKEVCEKMGNNGRKAYDELYSWKIMEGRLEKLYNNLFDN